MYHSICVRRSVLAHSHGHVWVHLNSVIIDDHVKAKVCAESTLSSIIRTLARLTIYGEPVREPTPADLGLYQATISHYQWS